MVNIIFFSFLESFCKNYHFYKKNRYIVLIDFVDCKIWREFLKVIWLKNVILRLTIFVFYW